MRRQKEEEEESDLEVLFTYHNTVASWIEGGERKRRMAMCCKIKAIQEQQ